MKILGRLLVKLCLALVIVYAVRSHAVPIEVIENTPVFAKDASGKTKKLGMAKVGRTFESQGLAGNGKFYKITVKGKSAFLKASACKEVGEGASTEEETSSSSDSRGKGFYLEPGINWESGLGLAPQVGAFFGIPVSSAMSFDLGLSYAGFFLNEFAKVNNFALALRMSFDVGAMSLSPELNYTIAMVSGSSSSEIGFGFFAGIPMGAKSDFVPGARMILSGGSLGVIYNANFRFRF